MFMSANIDLTAFSEMTFGGSRVKFWSEIRCIPCIFYNWEWPLRLTFIYFHQLNVRFLWFSEMIFGDSRVKFWSEIRCIPCIFYNREWPLRLTFIYFHQLNVRFLWLKNVSTSSPRAGYARIASIQHLNK